MNGTAVHIVPATVLPSTRRYRVNIKCKACGGEMRHVQLTAMPPIDKYTCKKCGRVVEQRPETVEIEK